MNTLEKKNNELLDQIEEMERLREEEKQLALEGAKVPDFREFGS